MKITTPLIGGLIGGLIGLAIWIFIGTLLGVASASATDVLNLDSDLMDIYPDPGKPVTILEDMRNR